MKSFRIIFLTSCLIISIDAFGGSDDRFIKKYAMMKIYENCFGMEVIKEVRNEMKSATLKCASYQIPPRPQYRPPVAMKPLPTVPPKLEEGVMDPENALYANAQAVDPEKMNNGILSYKPHKYHYMNFIPSAPYRPYQPPNVYAGFPNPASVYLANPFQQYLPYQQPGYPFPFVDQSYYGGQRTAKYLDNFRQEMEMLTSKMSVRARNLTCIMQELGYLDDSLEPNYTQIKERIKRLPVQAELRDDIEDGVSFCQQISQCVPDVSKEKTPLSKEFFRPMFFFKCYKHKKVEACVMKDMREKYASLNDSDFDGMDVELQRHGRNMKSKDDEMDSLTTTVYDLLYGSDDFSDISDFF